MTKVIETRQLGVFAAPMEALAFDISRLAVYKERVQVTYQYLDASGAVLNAAARAVSADQLEVVENTLLLSVAGALEVNDNAPNTAVSVRLTLDSALAPQPTESPLDPSLTAEELQAELLKRDLQDVHVLEEGRPDGYERPGE